MPEVAVHVIVCTVGILRRGLSTPQLLPSYQLWAFCSLCICTASGLDVSLQNYLYCKMEGAKLMKCLFDSQRPSIVTAKGQWHCYVLWFLRWDTVSGVCGRVRGSALSECTFVMALYKRTTHHVKQGSVQWKSIMLWCIDSYHLDSWQVTERCFWGRDSGLCLIFFCDFH